MVLETRTLGVGDVAVTLPRRVRDPAAAAQYRHAAAEYETMER